MSMRELSKSVLSFSWALSLLGIKQAVGLVMPNKGGRSASNILDPVTETTVGQLDESMKGIFRSGDNIQGKMVDMMFGMFDPGNLNMMKWMGDLGRKAASGFTQSPSSTSAPSANSASTPPPPTNVNATTAGSSAGWGPMPGDTSQ
jgi:hypothetical protein